MTLLYNFLIRSYVILIYILAPFNAKAKKWKDGRKGLLRKLQAELPAGEKRIWFHVSSLGEFEQGRPVMEAVKEKYPEYKLVLTFFSPSGYEVRKDYALADYVYYLPSDSRRHAQKFLKIVAPAFAVFVKYEYWHHYLKQLEQREIPTYMVSAIFRPAQLFFKPWGAWYRKMLTRFTFLFVQNEESLQLMKSIGITQVEVGGDTRFDRVLAIAKQNKELPLVASFCGERPVLIGGSTWEKDENLLLQYFQEETFSGKLILAPHEVHEKNIERIVAMAPDQILRYSQATPENVRQYSILLIDSIGILSSLYKYGAVAYIGNGFGSGIHNTLEAATFGLPVVFGPNYLRFQEACDLVKLQAGFSIQDSTSLRTTFNLLFSDKNKLQNAGKIASTYVKQQSGGTVKFLQKVQENQVL